MKHLKNFDSILEAESMIPMDNNFMSESPEIYAEEWVKSDKEDGDYDITWTNENGETVTASFADVTPQPMPSEGNLGYLTFESLPGTSSDGNEYIGNVTLKEKDPVKFEIVKIGITKK